MKKLVYLFVPIVLFFSCNLGDENKQIQSNPFLGTWTFHNESASNNLTVWLSFYSDGTFNYISDYNNDYSSELNGIYTYDENELNFIYIYNNRNYDEFQRYKFYETYLRIWNTNGYISGENYTKSETTIPKKNDPLYNIDISWSIVQNSPFDDLTVNQIIFVNGKFIASAYKYNETTENYSSKMAYSTDGIEWNICQSSNEFPMIVDICYGNNIYLASYFNDFKGYIGYSYDGINWIFPNNGIIFESETISSIIFGEDVFVVCGSYGKMAYSYNGMDWYLVDDSVFGNESIFNIAYGNNMFVATGQIGKIAYSVDGINWILLQELLYGKGTIDIVFTNNYFIIWSGNKIAYSTNGYEWEKKDIKIANNSFSSWIGGIAFGNGLYVIGNNVGDIIFSNDLIYWKKVSDSKFGTNEPGRIDPINDIVFGSNKFVAIGYNGKIVYWTCSATRLVASQVLHFSD